MQPLTEGRYEVLAGRQVARQVAYPGNPCRLLRLGD